MRGDDMAIKNPSDKADESIVNLASYNEGVAALESIGFTVKGQGGSFEAGAHEVSCFWNVGWVGPDDRWEGTWIIWLDGGMEEGIHLGSVKDAAELLRICQVAKRAAQVLAEI